MKTQAPYDQTFETVAPVQAECWNFMGGKIYTLPKGTKLKIEHCYDSFHTTCITANEFDKAGHTVGIQLEPPTPAPGGGFLYLSGIGYRFIIENQALAAAIGVPMPNKTEDLVGDIIAYEEGKATVKQTKKLFKTLKKTGIGRHLQGHYSSRM